MFRNISQILEMKKKAEEMKANLEAITISENTSGITVECNGNRKILAIYIDENQLNNKSKLEDNMVLAINKALESSEKASFSQIGAMTGGMEGLAGLFSK